MRIEEAVGFCGSDVGHPTSGRSVSAHRGRRTAAAVLALAISVGGVSACGSSGDSPLGTVNSFLSAIRSNDGSKACTYLGSPRKNCADSIVDDFMQVTQQYGANLANETPVVLDQKGDVADVGFKGVPDYSIGCGKKGGHWLLDSVAVGQ